MPIAPGSNIRVGQKELLRIIVKLCDRHGSTVSSIGKVVAQKHGLSAVPQASIRQALMRAVKDGVVKKNETDVRFKLVSPSRLPAYLRNLVFKKKNRRQRPRHRAARTRGRRGQGRRSRRRKRKRRRSKRRKRRKRRKSKKRRRKRKRRCKCGLKKKRRRRRKKKKKDEGGEGGGGG
jgi:hypothetical protein